MDGAEARYEIRPYVEENLPQNVLEGKHSSGQHPQHSQHMHLPCMAPQVHQRHAFTACGTC